MNNFEQKGKTIQEIREAKARLEKDVSKLIKEFEEEYGIKVTGAVSGCFSIGGGNFKVYVDLEL